MSGDTNRTSADDTANLSLGKSSLIGVVGKFTLAIFGFVGVVFFYRDLGPTKIGAYYTVLAGAKIASQFQSSITMAIQKRVSEVNADQSAYLGLGVLAWGGTTVIGVIVILLLSPFAGMFDVSLAHLIGGLAMASVLGLFATANQFYVGIGNPGKGNWTDAIRSIFTLGGQVMLLLLGFAEFGLIWGFVFGGMLTAVGLFLFVRVFPSVPSRETIRRTANFVKWSLPNGLMNNIYNRLDVLVLWLVIGSTSVGYYQPALQLTIPATFVASGISQSLTVKSSGLDSQGRSVLEDLRNGMAYAGIVAIPLFFGALAIPSALMGTIFGPSATNGAGALVGLALFQICRSYTLSLNSTIVGTDRPDLLVKILVVTLVVNIPLAVILVQSYGLIGVVAATVIAEAFRLLLIIVAVVDLFGNVGLPREIIEQISASLIMYGVVKTALISGIVRVTGVGPLSLLIASGVIVYFLTLVVISRRFKHTIKTILRETISS